MGKLLLLKDVRKLGRAGDLVNTKPGYARNYLLPQGHAVLATPQALRSRAKIQEERRKQGEKDKSEAQEIAARMEEVVLVATVKVDPDGHMYGSVAPLDIIHLLKEQAGIEIDRQSVLLPHPIKKLGVYTVSFKLKEETKGQVSLKVIAEGSPLEEATAPAAQASS